MIYDISKAQGKVSCDGTSHMDNFQSSCRYVPFSHLNTIVVTLTNVIVISVFHALFWFTVTHGNFKDFCELFWFIFMYVTNVVCTQAKHGHFLWISFRWQSQFHDVLRVPIFISGSNLFFTKNKSCWFPIVYNEIINQFSDGCSILQNKNT